MTNSDRRWDKDEEFKDGKVYETSEGRIMATRHILVRYLQQEKGIDMDYNTDIPMSLDEIMDMVTNDMELFDFAFFNYSVIMHPTENGSGVLIWKIPEEMINSVLDNPHIIVNKGIREELSVLENQWHAKKRQKIIEKQKSYERAMILRISRKLNKQKKSSSLSSSLLLERKLERFDRNNKLNRKIDQYIFGEGEEKK